MPYVLSSMRRHSSSDTDAFRSFLHVRPTAWMMSEGFSSDKTARRRSDGSTSSKDAGSPPFASTAIELEPRLKSFPLSSIDALFPIGPWGLLY